MKTKIKPLLIFLLLLILTIYAVREYYTQQESANVFTGTIEVTKADITSKTSGYMNELLFKEGDFLTKNDLVAHIDRQDVTAALLRDTASLKKAQAQLLDLEKGARPAEIREAAANTTAAQAAFDKSARDYTRANQLYSSGAIAKQQLDDALASYDAAAAQLHALQEKEQLVQAGNREDQITAAREEVARSQAVLTASKASADDLAVYSPLTGFILTKNYEPGEYIAAGAPIATIADLSDCWVKVYISSAELGRIKIGSTATVKVDAFPDRSFTGSIREISDTAEYTPRQSITKNERANMVFAVKVAIDNTENIMKPGMPADVIFP